ncbi:Pre-rRNA-processing protein IPI3 [Entamoeba marina]
MSSLIATSIDGMSYLINPKNAEIQCRWKLPQNITATSAVAYCPLQKDLFFNVVSKSSILEPISTIMYIESYIIAGTISGKVCIWDSISGLLLRQFQAHNKKVNSIVFAKENGILISGGEDSVIRGWNFSSVFLSSAPNPLFTYTAHSLPITHLIVGDGINPGIISASLDNTIKCWKIGETTPTASITLPSQPLCISVNSEKTIVNVGCIDGKVYRIPILYAPQFDRLSRKQEMDGRSFEHGNLGPVRHIIDNNDTLFASYQNGTIIIYDCETTEPLLVIDEIKSAVIKMAYITTPTHFNSLTDLTIKKTKEWKVEPLLLKKYPATNDDVLTNPIVICDNTTPKNELLNNIFSFTNEVQTVQTLEEDELETLRSEVQRWKNVNSQLMILLGKHKN